MRRIVINMQSFLFGDAIAGILRKEEFEFDVYKAEKPEEVVETCSYMSPYAVLMEVTGYTPWLLLERLKIRDELKKQNPDCKIVLVVDENSEEKLAKQVKQAKKDGLIDQFIYGSVSSTYLAAVMDTL